MSNSVVILMPDIHRNAQSVNELLARQDFYASYLRKRSDAQFFKPLVIIAGASTTSHFENIEVESLSLKPLNVLMFTLKSRSLIKNLSLKPDSLVAGTPFQSFLSALILKLFSPRARIHTAIHGDLTALQKSGSVNFLKLLFLRLFINRSYSVRFVSKKQAAEAGNLIALKKVKTFIAPVPYRSSIVLGKKVKSSPSIAFVGRIQRERGVEEWIEIVKPYDTKRLMIIGDGPLAGSMKSALQGAVFAGALTNREVQGKWVEIGVLLSTAPYESYGLAMREALLHGVPVVSRENAGAGELQQRYPDLIKLYKNMDQAQQYLHEFLEKPLNEEKFNIFRRDFFIEQEESLNRLAEVWRNEI